jgi:hypothetical protein
MKNTRSACHLDLWSLENLFPWNYKWLFGRCLDGIVLLKIQIPASNEVGNMKSFFSGHYQTHGINVLQAACDLKCHFRRVCIAAPGGSHAVAAFRKIPLHKIVHALPIEKYMIGNNAHI